MKPPTFTKHVPIQPDNRNRNHPTSSGTGIQGEDNDKVALMSHSVPSTPPRTRETQRLSFSETLRVFETAGQPPEVDAEIFGDPVGPTSKHSLKYILN